MKNAMSIAVTVGLVTFLGGCAMVRAPVVPPIAGLYTDIEAPLDVDFEATPVGTKSGEASTTNILGMISTGDASVRTAAANGGISTIHSADYRYTNVLGIFQRYTTIVRGE